MRVDLNEGPEENGEGRKRKRKMVSDASFEERKEEDSTGSWSWTSRLTCSNPSLSNFPFSFSSPLDVGSIHSFLIQLLPSTSRMSSRVSFFLSSDSEEQRLSMMTARAGGAEIRICLRRRSRMQVSSSGVSGE